MREDWQMRYIAVLLMAIAADACWAAEAETKPPEPQRAQVVANGTVRIKDLADVYGARENQLIGQGLVVGLDNTGDQSGYLMMQVLANLESNWGIVIPYQNLQPKNVAVVAVTATLSPFLKKGSKIDVQVSSVGDSTSLAGGILLQCPLQGGDRQVYAVAQGALSVGGFSAKGGAAGGAAVTKNHMLVGRVPNGALVEREVETAIVREGLARIILRRPDFTTAERMTEVINGHWASSCKAIDPCTVEFKLPALEGDKTEISILSELECLRLMPDAAASVVINERTGTIVAGSQVRLMPTVLAHGNLFITVKSNPIVSQPFAYSNGTTRVLQDTNVTVKEEHNQALVVDPGPTLADLAAALNSLKVAPRDIIAIFQALKEAGALNAELKIL